MRVVDGGAGQFRRVVGEDLLPRGAAGALALLVEPADAGQALGAGPDDPAVLVVPGAGLVLLQDREVDPVDLDQLVEGQAERLRDQHVDLDQRHAAGELGAQAGGAVPCDGALDRAFDAKARIDGRPRKDFKRRRVAVPEIGIG